MRPLVVSQETEELNIDGIKKSKILCQSNEFLCNGVIKDIKDIIVVDIHKFDRAKSREVAMEVNQFNGKMLQENRPYLLIGVG